MIRAARRNRLKRSRYPIQSIGAKKGMIPMTERIHRVSFDFLTDNEFPQGNGGGLSHAGHPPPDRPGGKPD